MKTLIYHWRFEDGVTAINPINPVNQFGETICPRGWYCWVYPEDNGEFETWMTRNCPTADIAHRFNSGDLMWTVYIKDDAEATLFNLKWQ